MSQRTKIGQKIGMGYNIVNKFENQLVKEMRGSLWMHVSPFN